MAATATLFAFLVYLLTLAPGITWHNDGADGGDLIAAVVTGGVPHPSGYPTYLLIGELVARIPVGDLAYRFNLLSAAAAAGATGLTLLAAAVAVRKTDATGACVHQVAASVAALTFAFSSILWSQAVITEVYALNAFFVALVLYLGLRARATGSTSLLWLLAAGAFGLGLGNHLSLLALAPVGLLLYWSALRAEGPAVAPAPGARPVGVVVIGAALAFLAGLAVYVALPLRAAQHSPVNWGGADTWSGFIWLVTGRAYAPLVGALPVGYLPQRILAAAALLVRQVSWWGVPVAYLGVQAMWRRDRPLAAGTLLSGALIVAYAVSYNTSDSYVYLIPAALVLAVWVAWGLVEALAALAPLVAPIARQRIARLAAYGAIAVLIGVPLVANWGLVDASRDRAAQEYGVQSLAAVPDDALIIGDSGTDTFALWYFRYAEARHPAVTVVNGRLLAYDWYRESLRRWHPEIEMPAPPVQEPGTTAGGMAETVIEANLGHRPIYLTTTTWGIPSDCRLVSEAGLYRVQCP